MMVVTAALSPLAPGAIKHLFKHAGAFQISVQLIQPAIQTSLRAPTH